MTRVYTNLLLLDAGLLKCVNRRDSLEISHQISEGDGKTYHHEHNHSFRNPNFHCILNWILQILHYDCSKHHKNIQNLVYRTKCCYLFLFFSLFTATCASFAFLNSRYFSVLGHTILRNFKRHKWSFVPLH